MRALREPDAFPSGDPEFARILGVARTSEVDERSEPWRPWRAYAAMYRKQLLEEELQASNQRTRECGPVPGAE